MRFSFSRHGKGRVGEGSEAISLLKQMVANSEPMSFPPDPTEATRVYSFLIINFSRELQQNLVAACLKQGPLPNNPLQVVAAVFLESCYFFLHVTDRLAFAKLGASGRVGLFDPIQTRTITDAVLVVKGLIDELAKSSEREALRRFAAQAGDGYNVATSEYAGFRFIVPANAPLPATVLGHFIRRSKSTLGMDPGALVEMSFAALAMAQLKSLNPDSLINVWEKADPSRRHVA